jgi:hypothetical protein
MFATTPFDIANNTTYSPQTLLNAVAKLLRVEEQFKLQAVREGYSDL